MIDSPPVAEPHRMPQEVQHALVLGAHGMLGTVLAHRLKASGWQVSALDRQQCDAAQLRPEELELRPGLLVLNAIGLINRRIGHHPDSEFWKVNGLWPRVLADACQAEGAHLVHISTDCVFSGEGAPHDEHQVPAAKDLYGASKAAGEPSNALVLRTSIIGPESHHRYSLMCWLLGQAPGARVRGFVNHLWNGLTTLEVANVIVRLTNQGRHRQHGLRHLHGQDVTKCELLQWMAARWRPDLQIEPVDDVSSRDMRLCSAYPEFLRACGVQPLPLQLDELRAICAADGAWQTKPEVGSILSVEGALGSW
jgi:dTDP-4-dehydrorhamnose reductase